MSAEDFSDRVIAWQRLHGRQDLPWQRDSTPYRVWVSEVMLQQTGVGSVVGYFERFMTRFESLKTLAEADEEAVLALWAGLGYYARGRHLHKSAQILQAACAPELPDTLEALCALPGIGLSTAGAILALGFGKRGVVCDGNVKRVLARYHAIDQPLKGPVLKTLWQYADRHTPDRDCGPFVQGMMDLGATLCTRHNPRCIECPLKNDCKAHRLGLSRTLPLSLPRGALPLRENLLILAYQKGQIYLLKRPSRGLWGGLWTPPMVPVGSPIEQEVIQKLEPFVHTFSHFRLRLFPVVTRPCTDDEGVWFDLGDLPPVPAPITRLLGQVWPALGRS